MQDGTESPLVAAQRGAILQIRGRYERGELPYENFREALDAITEARSPEECASIIRDLPQSPLAVLAALEPPRLVATAAPVQAIAPLAPSKRISAFMSDTKKTNNPWTLGPSTEVRCTMGSVKLDMRRAQLPTEAFLDVRAIMGDIMIIVPDDVAVTVRSRAIMAEVKALGETISGVVANGEEQYIPVGVEPRAHLDIVVDAIMADVKVALSSSMTVSISDLVQETMRAALDGVRRGLASGAPADPTLPPPNARATLPRGYPAE